MQAWHLEIPAKSMGVGKHSMDISIIFCRIGRKPPEGLSQENIVYIEYFHIEIFIYFHINESSQCALGRIFFIRISIFLVDFFAPEVKWLAKSRAFAFSSLFLFLFLHREQCFTTWNGAQDFFFFPPHFFSRWEDFLVKVMQGFLLSSHRARILRRVGWFSANRSAVGVPLYCGWVIGPPSISVCWTACMQPSRHAVCFQSVLPAPTTLSQQQPAISINSRTTSWQESNGKSEPPATGNDGENECRSFESAKNAEENKPAPTKRESEGKSGRSLNRLERCPNHWKRVIGLYFTLPPEK